MPLKNKTALVTGGGRGIGRDIALAFAREGARVAICDVNPESIQKTVDELKNEGSDSLGLRTDVADFKQVEDMVNKILDKLKRVDILVNNAGITKDALLLRMTPEDWEAVINVNLNGAFNCTKAVSRAMIKQRYGKIVNVASIIGIIGNAGQANYAASKAGIIAFTKTVARELASRNINVNAVAPGFIQTEMTARLSADIQQKMLKQIPSGRFGTPADVANVCLFLSSDNADFITGQTIVVDGGMVMH